MTIWRINLKPGSEDGVDAREHCLTSGIVGIGWQVEYEEVPVSATYYQETAEGEYANDGGWWPAWNALYNKMEMDDLIWTRDWDGVYYLGRVAGDWYYDVSELASHADIVNVRQCEWVKVGTVESVPGKLVRCFMPSRTLQKVADETVAHFSRITFNQKKGQKYYDTKLIEEHDIFSLLSAEDCEDVVALYLQLEKEYMMIPSSCKKDTMAYEYELIHRITSEKAVVQVKNGRISLNGDDYVNVEETVFLFTTKGIYLGKERDKLFCIDPEIIRRFIFNHIAILPGKIKVWVDQVLEATQISS